MRKRNRSAVLTPGDRLEVTTVYGVLEVRCDQRGVFIIAQDPEGNICGTGRPLEGIAATGEPDLPPHPARFA